MQLLAASAMVAALTSLGAAPAPAEVLNAGPAASAPSRAAARPVTHETRPTTAEPSPHPGAPAPLPPWQRWGERLLALGVGAGVGWLLLRLGREGEASRPGSTGTR